MLSPTMKKVALMLCLSSRSSTQGAVSYTHLNIQCNGIGPGYIATPQTAPLREKQADGSRHPFDSFICAKTPAEMCIRDRYNIDCDNSWRYLWYHKGNEFYSFKKARF